MSHYSYQHREMITIFYFYYYYLFQHITVEHGLTIMVYVYVHVCVCVLRFLSSYSADDTASHMLDMDSIHRANDSSLCYGRSDATFINGTLYPHNTQYVIILCSTVR